MVLQRVLWLRPPPPIHFANKFQFRFLCSDHPTSPVQIVESTYHEMNKNQANSRVLTPELRASRLLPWPNRQKAFAAADDARARTQTCENQASPPFPSGRPSHLPTPRSIPSTLPARDSPPSDESACPDSDEIKTKLGKETKEKQQAVRILCRFPHLQLSLPSSTDH